MRCLPAAEHACFAAGVTFGSCSLAVTLQADGMATLAGLHFNCQSRIRVGRCAEKPQIGRDTRFWESKSLFIAS
jgi:hypothetical protein